MHRALSGSTPPRDEWDAARVAEDVMSAPVGVLEREGELGALDGLLEDALDGRGRLVVVEAPPGLGKSTLLAYAVAQATGRGMLALRAAGRELEREFGWGVTRSLFETWLLDLPDAERDALLAGPAAPARRLFAFAPDGAGPGGAEAAFALLHGLYWLTVRAAEREPLLLVVDDAQWADAPSLRFLLYLAGRQADLAVAALVAARTGEAGAGGLVSSLLSDASATVLGLPPLSRTAVATLVRRRVHGADDALCAQAFELTSGNPLFVRELVTAVGPAAVADVRASAERAAASLSRVVLRRLSALPRDAQTLARAVAVFEGGVALDDARALAGLEAATALQAADALARADILRPDDPLEFVHPLLRAAVYGALGRHERAAVHAGAARHLRARGAPAEQVAAHLLLTAPDADADVVSALLAAAREALAHGVPTSAIAYVERALREPPAPAALGEVLTTLARAELLAGRREATDHLEQALAATAERGDRARLWLELSRALHDFGRLDDACAACERGLDELDGAEGRDDELGLDLQAAWFTSAMILVDRAAEAQRRAAAVLRRPPASTRAGRTLEVKARHLAMYMGGTPHGGTASETAAAARRLWAGGRLLDEEGLGSQVVAHIGGWLSYCDDYDAAREVLETVLARARREGWSTYVAASSQLLGRQELWTGPLEDAIEHSRAAFDIFASGLLLYAPASAYVLARGLLEADRVADALTVLARLDAGPAPSGMFAAWRAEIDGRIAAHRGDHEKALDSHLRAGELLGGAIPNPTLFHWRSEASLAALRTGDRALAERLIGEERRLAEAFGSPRAIGVALRAAGLLARGEDAVTLLRSAAELHAACGAGLERALSLTELGGAIRRAGRRSEAREVLRDAIRIADRLGAAVVATRARDELTRAGGRAPAARDTAGDLTPSERRVAELAATGRTNRQIADELFVTVKAVEWHLANCYRKLEIRGRADLAAALDRMRVAA
jgi:DNA-binding CsgD family transcriptional regulator